MPNNKAANKRRSYLSFRNSRALKLDEMNALEKTTFKLITKKKPHNDLKSYNFNINTMY